MYVIFCKFICYFFEKFLYKSFRWHTGLQMAIIASNQEKHSYPRKKSSMYLAECIFESNS